MKKKFFETDSFAQIQNEWYTKLRNEGFVDIEVRAKDTIVRPQVFTTPQVRSETGMDYYQYCQAVLRSYPFARDVDRLVFEQHAEGKSERQIVDYLKQHSTKKLSQKGVNLVLNKIKQDAGKFV